MAKNRLSDDGVLTQWLPAYQIGGDVARSMIRAFVDVFPDAVMITGFHRHLILVGKRTGLHTVDPDVLARALQARPEVRADLEAHSMGSPLEIVGSFVADAKTLDAATREWPSLTDDWPIQEYAFRAGPLFDSVMPGELFDPSHVSTWCPTCRDKEGNLVEAVADLDTYLSIVGAWYQSPDFRIRSPLRRVPPMKWSLEGNPEDIERVWFDSEYLMSLR